MKRKDIDKALKKAGWIISHGGNHDLATPKSRELK